LQVETTYPVRLEQDVIWGEQDLFGHVNNTVYFRYFENVRVAHFREIGMLMPSPGSAGAGPILASTRCDFKLPLTFPDRVRIETGVLKLGTSSYTYGYRIWSYAQQAYAALGEGVVVYYDYEQKKSVPLPEALRRRILDVEGL
jgi:acyl-CoA thioester hydrolase